LRKSHVVGESLSPEQTKCASKSKRAIGKELCKEARAEQEKERRAARAFDERESEQELTERLLDPFPRAGTSIDCPYEIYWK